MDKDFTFLGATPDGIIGDKGIVEIKCPLSATGKDVELAVREGKIRYLKLQGNNLELKKNHEYYYQVQGQLHISEREFCIFGVWTSHEKQICDITITKDDKFWKEEMEPKLLRFYHHCMLPELVDPRHTRNMEIRNPSYISQAQEERGKIKKST